MARHSMNIVPKKMLRLSSALLLSSGLSVASAAPYDDAVLAFENRDYDTALSLSLPLARGQDVAAMTLVVEFMMRALISHKKPWHGLKKRLNWVMLRHN